MEQREIDRIQQGWIERYVCGDCLHVGCGQKRIEGAVNIDPNPDRAEWADFPFDVHDLSFFEDESFDSVVSSHVLQALEDPVRALREMARVMRPGAVMAHVVPDHRYAPRLCDTRYPFQFQHQSWHGPEEFAPVMDEVGDVLAVVILENFKAFDWSFKVVAMRQRRNAVSRGGMR